MPKIEWPGIATAVGVLLTLTLIIVGSRDDFHLHDWQPLMAALIALTGGILAYTGAMAKLRQDGELQMRELLRRKLGLCLKLDIAIRSFFPTIIQNHADLHYSKEGEHIPVESLALIEPPEITEAWDNLDVFPRKVIREIASVREHLRELAILLEDVPKTGVLVKTADLDKTRIGILLPHFKAIHDACKAILEGLEPEIERLAAKRAQNTIPV
jgi:hypothetical protein